MMSISVQTDVSNIIWDETLEQNQDYNVKRGMEMLDQRNHVNILPFEPLLNNVNSLVDKQEIRKATNKLLEYLSIVPEDKKAKDLALALFKSRGWQI